MGKFTKDDLQVNDIVTIRAGNSYIVHNFNDKLFAIREQGFLAFDDYNNDLTLKKVQNLILSKSKDRMKLIS